MRKILLLLLMLSLSGCATDGKVVKSISPSDLWEVGKSSLVYRSSEPAQVQSSISVTHQPGDTNASLLNSAWIQNLNYRDIGIGAGELVRSITAPTAFPFSILFSTIDPVASIFKQEMTVELKRLGTLENVKVKEIWFPKNATKVHVQDGNLIVDVESAKTSESSK